MSEVSKLEKYLNHSGVCINDVCALEKCPHYKCFQIRGVHISEVPIKRGFHITEVSVSKRCFCIRSHMSVLKRCQIVKGSELERCPHLRSVQISVVHIKKVSILWRCP